MAGCGPVTLENIQIAAPCSATWAEMSGDARVRHCQFCRKNVYNISEMSRVDAENLIRQKEGNLCVRFYQRADGTILTDNCPVGLRAIRRRLKWVAAGVAALLGFGVTSIWAFATSGNGPAGGGGLRTAKPIDTLQHIQPFKAVIDYVDPPQQNVLTMGKCVVKR